METIAQKLREYFDSQGITQQDIANKFGVKKQTINPYITGAKPFGKKVAQQWADAFGLSVSWLLTGEGEMLKGSAERSDVSLCFETIQGGIGHGTGAEQMTKANAVGVMAVPGVPIGEGTPIEIVSKMLGHTNIKTTQIYAKILAKDVDAQFERLDGLF